MMVGNMHNARLNRVIIAAEEIFLAAHAHVGSQQECLRRTTNVRHNSPALCRRSLAE